MAPASKAPQRDSAGLLTITPEKVCFVIIKAREFGAKDVPSDEPDASNPSDDREIAVLEDQADDPVFTELTSFIDSLNEDEQLDLVTLAWLGRGDGSVEDWAGLRQDATARHTGSTARYLCGSPLLADELEEGLSMLGLSCEDTEMGRL